MPETLTRDWSSTDSQLRQPTSTIWTCLTMWKRHANLAGSSTTCEQGFAFFDVFAVRGKEQNCGTLITKKYRDSTM